MGSAKLKNGMMPEADLLAYVIDVADAGKWYCYHTYDSRRSQPGFPDLVLTRDGRTIFIELKSQKGRTYPAQEEWLAELRKTDGIEIYLWRPVHIDDGTITETLLGHQIAAQ